MIVAEFLTLVEAWRPLFAQERTFHLAVQLALATLCQMGRHTVSQRIVLLDAHRADWNKCYRFFSQRVWEPARLFDVILTRALRWCHRDYLVVAADDTLCHKTGSCVHTVGYLRDPLSPKFRYNLVLGLRYRQLSLLLPLYETTLGEVTRACALPIRFRLAPVVRKAKRKKLTAAETEALAQAPKANTLSQYLVDTVTELRTWLNTHGVRAKKLLLVVDNGYCNSTVFSLRLARVEFLARAKSNYRLYRRDQATGRAVAGAGFTPEDIQKDGEHPWKKTPVWFGAGQAVIKYKEVRDLLWPGGRTRARCG